MERLNLRLAASLALSLMVRAASADDISQFALATKDLVYDRLTQKVYASVPGSAGSIGNTITVIDPLRRVIGPSVFIGSEPGKLALSDDGRYLYVALDGTAAVRRFDLATQTAGPQFRLSDPGSYGGPYFAGDLKVLPFNPGSVAVSRVAFDASYEDGRRPAGIAVYDDGIPRSDTFFQWMPVGGYFIEFGASPSRLYAV